MKKPIVLITGATSGIGEATARLLSTGSYDLILTGRRKDKLEAIARELSANTRIHVLHLDVRNRETVSETISSLPDDWKEIDVLVNNAGLAVGMGNVHDGDPDDWDRMIDTNIKGVLNMLKAVIPGMIQRKKGHIVQISSIAGKEIYPGGNVYCGTKSALDAITKSLRIELMPHSIRVSSVSPGMTETEFSLVRFKGNREKADLVYHNLQPLTGEDIAGIIRYCIELPPHIQVHDLVVTPTAQSSARDVYRRTES